jgi:hypothetical protein
VARFRAACCPGRFGVWVQGGWRSPQYRVSMVLAILNAVWETPGMASRRRMSEKRARTIADTTVLVKAATWSETRNWDVTADDGQILVVVTPAYGGTSASGRRGWTYYFADTGPTATAGGPWKTREEAAVQGLAAWIRWATTPPRR